MEIRKYTNLKNRGADPEYLELELLTEFCKCASTMLSFLDMGGVRATFENPRVYVLSEKDAEDAIAGNFSCGGTLRKPWGLGESSLEASVRLFEDISEPGTVLKVYSPDEPGTNDFKLMRYDEEKEQFAVLKL